MVSIALNQYYKLYVCCVCVLKIQSQTSSGNEQKTSPSMEKLYISTSHDSSSLHRVSMHIPRADTYFHTKSAKSPT